MESAFLVVDDEPRIARHIAQLIDPEFGVVRTGSSVREALAAIREQTWTAVLVDLMLPDGTGLEVITAARKRDPGIPALLFSGFLGTEQINEARPIGVQLLAKPFKAEDVLGFARDALLCASRDENEMARSWASPHPLTRAEKRTLALGLRGALAYKQISQLRRVSVETVRKQVKSLLKKTGDAGLPDLVVRAHWKRSGR